jgi:hypothetical protein
MRHDDDTPPREQVEAVAGDVVGNALHRDPPGGEQHDEPHRYHRDIVDADVRAALVKIVPERARCRGHGELERKRRGGAAVGAEHHG